MKISELPQDIKLKALEYQKKDLNEWHSKTTDKLKDAFDWYKTKEGGDYWEDINDGMFEPTKTDSIVESVVNQFKKRSEVGIKKYGVTLDRKDLSPVEWMIHFREELMDATLYIEKIIQEFKNEQNAN